VIARLPALPTLVGLAAAVLACGAPPSGFRDGSPAEHLPAHITASPFAELTDPG